MGNIRREGKKKGKELERQVCTNKLIPSISLKVLLSTGNKADLEPLDACHKG